MQQRFKKMIASTYILQLLSFFGIITYSGLATDNYLRHESVLAWVSALFGVMYFAVGFALFEVRDVMRREMPLDELPENPTILLEGMARIPARMEPPEVRELERALRALIISYRCSAADIPVWRHAVHDIYAQAGAASMSARLQMLQLIYNGKDSECPPWPMVRDALAFYAERSHAIR